MTKAFAYLRVSGKGQIEGDGFNREPAAIKPYAASHDIKVVKIFREEGISGTTELENRPALLELLEALASNGTNLVLIEKLDRLARDLMVQETIIGDLRKRGYDLVSVTEPDLLQRDPTIKWRQQPGHPLCHLVRIVKPVLLQERYDLVFNRPAVGQMVQN